tara:strand:- start:1975 stop:2523 length:549 start_codon:yes stop_codon:yes gene_type:complete
MSEEKQVQSAPKDEQPQNAQEMATKSQDQPTPSDVGELIAESKKYRLRSQKAEAELAKMKKQIEQGRQKQLEEQEQWKTLAEERANTIAELEPIVKSAKEQEMAMRTELLNDLSEEDRDTFGDLPMDKLRAIHKKLNTARITVANNPAIPVNEAIGEYRKIPDEDRQKNWSSILNKYKNRAN